MSFTGLRQFRLSTHEDSKCTIAPFFVRTVAFTRSRVLNPLLRSRPSLAMAYTSLGLSFNIQNARSAMWDIRNHSGPLCSAHVMLPSTHEMVSERTKFAHTGLPILPAAMASLAAINAGYQRLW